MTSSRYDWPLLGMVLVGLVIVGVTGFAVGARYTYVSAYNGAIDYVNDYCREYPSSSILGNFSVNVTIGGGFGGS